MARDIFGNKKVTREDKYTRKSTKFSDSEIRWEKFKIVIWLLLGYAYFHFIAMGWSW